MIEFIPLASYSYLFYQLILIINIIMWLNSNNSKLTSKRNLKSKQSLGFFLMILVIIYMGFRPINGAFFGDMITYAKIFNAYQEGTQIFFEQDFGFDIFMSFCSKVMTVGFFFFICAVLYVFPLYIASRRLFQEYWFYSFLILISSFSFWSFGTNGIRNGIATSLVLLAFSYKNKKIMMIAIMLIAVSFHKTMLLPVGAYFITMFYNDSKKIFYFWLLCIPLSLAAGGFFESLFGSLGFDDRISYLTAGNVNEDNFSSNGFRWDFLTYSATAVFTGWYFIFKKKFSDSLYNQLFNIFLICNGFWILVIRANFSNRFAYLSWFMMGVIIVYPFLKLQFFKNQHKVLANVLLLYFMFTYLMYMFLS